jgi:hypothetical protein
MDPTQFIKLLTLACHADTPDSEAASAARKAAELLDRNSLSLQNIRFRSGDLRGLPALVTTTALRTELEEAKRVRDAAEAEVAELRKEVERKDREIKALHATKRLTAETWEAFAILAPARLGRNHGWRQKFIDQYYAQKLSLGIMKTWERNNTVPAEVLAFAKTKLVSTTVFEAEATEQEWLFEEDDFLYAMHLNGIAPERMPSPMRKKYGRAFSVGSCKRSIQRTTTRLRILELWESGEHDVVAITQAIDAMLSRGWAGKSKRFALRVLRHAGHIEGPRQHVATPESLAEVNAFTAVHAENVRQLAA